MVYTNKVIEHFKHPHNQGSIPDADATGEEGNPICGDVMKIYLKIDNRKQKTDSREEYIKDIKFETLGCAAAIAVSSALTDLVKGKTLDEAMKVTKDTIVDDLGGLPVQKVHCSMLGVDALRKAIENYRSKK
jgi:nitrogen fixation NifU-like protein